MMMFVRTAFCIGLLAVRAIGAQTQAPAPVPTTAVAIENTNSAMTPTTEDIPIASPSRPTITGPAHIPPTGYLQFEQGFNRADATPSGLSAQSSISQTTKIALTTRLMVQFISQPYTFNVVDAGGRETISTATGDLDAGGQFIVHKEAGSLPTVAVGYVGRVRTGPAPNLDVGDPAESVILLLSGDLPGGLHYDANAYANEQRSGDNSASSPRATRRGQFAETISVSMDLFSHATGGRLNGSFEVASFTQPYLMSTSTGRPIDHGDMVDLMVAGGYSLRPNLVLDADVSRGLTSTSTRWQGGFGFTYVLPHRLWRDRHPMVQQVGHHGGSSR